MSYRQRIGRLALRVLIGASVLTAIGCPESLKVRVVTTPADASGMVTRIKEGGATDRQYVFASDSPLKLKSDKTTSSFLFEAEREGYQSEQRQLSPAAIKALPIDSRGFHVVEFELTNEYEIQQQIIIVYDPDRGDFVGRPRTVRAWRNTGGDDKGSVSRVFDRLDRGAGIRGLAMSPNGDQLVFAEAEAEGADLAPLRPQANNIIRLKSCNLKSISINFSGGRGDPRAGGITHIRPGDYIDVDPGLTSDGQHVLFASNRRRSDSADILQVNAKGRTGGIRDIYRVPGRGTALSPSMGADGTIAFAIYDPDSGRTQVWTVAGGRFPTEIINGAQPAISPDGAKIAYIGDDMNLWVVGSDGTAPTQITFKAPEIGETYYEALTDVERAAFDPTLFAPYSFPTWTPDGRKIAFTSMDGVDSTDRPNDDIWIVDADGTNPVQITSNGSIDSNPVVSPNGRWIFFISNRGGQWAIWASQLAELEP